MGVGTYSDAKKLDKVAEAHASYQATKEADEPLLSTKEIDNKIEQLEKSMYIHAQNLEFEKAAAIRDDIDKLRLQQLSS
jgi:excinuclease ABC subunit B